MRYIVLVSHGTFAPALLSAAEMIIGNQKNMLCANMPDGMGADAYIESVRRLTEDMNGQDQILLLADLAEGSPMTNALMVLGERGLMDNTIAFAGMNLPMVVTAAMLDENMSPEEIENAVLEESHRQIRVMKLQESDDEDI